ncbi:MAG TPA: hypothetical protein VGM56_11380, partial [Byssovorax sp.]
MRLARFLVLSLAIASCDAAPQRDAIAPPRLADGFGAQAGGSVVVDSSGAWAFAADADAHAVRALDLATRRERRTDVAGAPEQIALLDARRIAVTLRDKNEVVVYAVGDDGALTAVAAIDVPTDPFGLARTPSGDLLVTSAFGRRVSLVDVARAKVAWSLPTQREPRGVVVTADGARAFVSHLVGDVATVVELAGDTPRLHTLSGLGGLHRNRLDGAVRSGTLHPVPALGYAVALSPSGARVFFPHVVEQNGATAQVVPGSYGGVPEEDDTSVASVSVVSAAAPAVLGAGDAPSHAASPLHGSNTPAPTAAVSRQARAAVAVGDRLYVTSLGTDDVVALDARAIDPATAPLDALPVCAGPTGIAALPGRDELVVWCQFDAEFALVDVADRSVTLVRAADGDRGASLSATAAAGRKLFHAEGDRRISRDGRACAGCHPEGRDDGVVWKLGEGPRQTPTLVGRVAHGPFGWRAKHAVLEDNIAETIGRLGGRGLPKGELAELATFLREGLVAPRRAPVVDTPEIARGRALFTDAKVGCSSCHA